MYGRDSWTIKKGEHQRTDAFELWSWRRRLRVPWTARRANQSILKQISPEYSLEGLMLKLKLQYFGHLMLRADSWKGPDSGEDWRQEEKGMSEDEMVGWHLPTRQTWVWANSRIWQWTGKPSKLQSMESQRAGHDWATGLNWIFHCVYVPHLLYPFNCWGHLGCFHDLAIVNSAAMNTGLHVYFQTMFTYRYMPRSGIAGS